MPDTVKPYENSGSKKEQVTTMFDNIAPRYDLLNRVLSMGIDVYWRKRAIALLKDKAPQHILDMATGTADVAIELAQTLQPRHIEGVDISNEMLAYGREKVKAKGLEHIITLTQGDSENLQYADNTFDAVTVSFGVRNFEELSTGLAELYRVLRTGGQIVVLEFSRPTAAPFKQLYNFYFKNILPGIGRLTSKDPRAYTYLFESVQAFPDGNQFQSFLQQVGFTNTRYIPLTFGICTLYYGEKQP